MQDEKESYTTISGLTKATLGLFIEEKIKHQVIVKKELTNEQFMNILLRFYKYYYSEMRVKI